MKCPLYYGMLIDSKRELVSDRGDCLKDACAWYSGASQSCAVWLIASQLYLAVEVAEEIREKLSELIKVEASGR